MTRTHGHDLEPTTQTDLISDDGHDNDTDEAQKHRRIRRLLVLLAGGAIVLGGGTATALSLDKDEAPAPTRTEAPVTPGPEQQGPTAAAPETETSKPADVYLDGQGMTIEEYVSQRSVSADMINQPPEVIAQAFFDKVFLPAANANADYRGVKAHEGYVTSNDDQIGEDHLGFDMGVTKFNDDLFRNQVGPANGMDGGISEGVFDKIRELNGANAVHSSVEGANRSTTAKFDFSNANMASSTNMNGERSGSITFVVRVTSALEQDPNYNDQESLKFTVVYSTKNGNPNLLFDGTNIDENSPDTKKID
jgi:hypothetical protein